MRTVAKSALKHLKDVDEICISFDINVLDNTLVPGTEIPVPNGLKVS